MRWPAWRSITFRTGSDRQLLVAACPRNADHALPPGIASGLQARRLAHAPALLRTGARHPPIDSHLGAGMNQQIDDGYGLRRSEWREAPQINELFRYGYLRSQIVKLALSWSGADVETGEVDEGGGAGRGRPIDQVTQSAAHLTLFPVRRTVPAGHPSVMTGVARGLPPMISRVGPAETIPPWTMWI